MRYLLSLHQSFSHRLVAIPSAIAVTFSGLIIGVPEVKAQAENQCSDSSSSSKACEWLERGANFIPRVGPYVGAGVAAACELYDQYQQHPEYSCGILLPDPAYGYSPDAQELYEECLKTYKSDILYDGDGFEDDSSDTSYSSDDLYSSNDPDDDPTDYYDESAGMCMAP